jgi:hypothetical protein
MKPIEQTVLPHHQITDVVSFFADITHSYLDFAQRVLLLTHTLPIYSPEQILAECKKLAAQREKLALYDQRLLAILELAGSAIVNTPLIDDYRAAFAETAMACDNLRLTLLDLKGTLAI